MRVYVPTEPRVPFVAFLCGPQPGRPATATGCASATGPKFFDDVLESSDDFVLFDLGLLEAQSQVEGLGGRPEGEDEVLGAPLGGLCGFPPSGLPRCRA